MPNKIRDDYENEFQNWIDSIWLIPYTEEEIQPFKGLIILMTMVQHNKIKVHSLMDYQEINIHVNRLDIL